MFRKQGERLLKREERGGDGEQSEEMDFQRSYSEEEQ